MNKSAAARLFGIGRKTVAKILKHSVPPGYQRSKPPVRSKLDPFIPVIDLIQEDDDRVIKKQCHTAKRIHSRFRDEHGFAGGITIVTDSAHEKQRRTREVFVPLTYALGHAQVDFGEMLGVVGGVPLSALYDNTVIAVAMILGDGKRVRTRTFSELQSQYLFEDKCGRSGKGHYKGKVEGVVRYGRRNFLVPAPRFENFGILNAWMEEQCLERQDDVVRGHTESIGERLTRDLDALMALPPTPNDACEKVSTRSASISTVRFRNSDFSVHVAFAHHEIQVRGYIHEFVTG